jgi:enolase
MPALLDREIIPALVGLDANEQEKIDDLLVQIDGSANFERIGGNTSSVLSIAVARAAADTKKIPLYKHLKGNTVFTLPTPLGNVIGGGAHSLGPAPDQRIGGCGRQAWRQCRRMKTPRRARQKNGAMFV